MSMVMCEQCETLIDSDDDPDCFVEVLVKRNQHVEEIYCRACRQEMENANERAWDRQQEGEPPITQQERYMDAWNEKQKLKCTDGKVVSDVNWEDQ